MPIFVAATLQVQEVPRVLSDTDTYTSITSISQINIGIYVSVLVLCPGFVSVLLRCPFLLTRDTIINLCMHACMHTS